MTMLCLSPLGILMLYRSRNDRINSTLIQRVPQKPLDWDVIRRGDANFSHVLFRDFAYTLFAKVHEARGDGGLERFRQFIDSDALKDLRALNPEVRDVYGVIVGGFKINRVNVGQSDAEVALTFDANYTEDWGSGPPASVYSVQVWTLRRDRAAKSLPPESVTVFDCLACGSSFEPSLDGVCLHCGENVSPGLRHWALTSVTERVRRPVGPALTTFAPDVGLHLPTVFAPDYQDERKRFEREHPKFDHDVMTNRFRHIFLELQAAWSAQDLHRLRPFETDSLFQNHSYWVREYKKQGLRNELGQVRIQKLQMVKIRSDKFYDAMTCRIFASMTDCTRWSNGEIACGSPNVSKRFSEYWTFIRGRGAAEHKHGNQACPNCGAKLDINMAGVCEYCDSKITSGQFDWVLSEIQQDEIYGR